MQGPADYTESETDAGSRPALLQGKILRGGMGTGMPSWESEIHRRTDLEILVAYLYSFQFEYR